MEGLNAIVAYICAYLVAMYQLQLLQSEKIGKAITNLERDGFNVSASLCWVSSINYFRIF